MIKINSTCSRLIKGIVISVSIVIGVFLSLAFILAFQTYNVVPTAPGSADSSNNSKSYPLFTTATGNVFDRATMSLQAMKSNFTTLLADTSTIKTTTANIDTRTAGQICISWAGAVGVTCPVGWTYNIQSTIWSGNKSNICCK